MHGLISRAASRRPNARACAEGATRSPVSNGMHLLQCRDTYVKSIRRRRAVQFGVGQ